MRERHITRRCLIGSGAAGLALATLDVGGPAGCARAPTPSPPASPPRLGAALIRLDLNENPFGPSPAAIDAIRGALDTLARYTGEEATALAQQIASFERVPEECIVLGEVLEPLGAHLALSGEKGGKIVYSSPGFTALADAAQSVGGVGVAVPLDARLENDLPALGARIDDRTLAVFLVNPHNPSGTVTDPSDFRAFVTKASRQTLVIVDEAYLEFTDDFSLRTCVGEVRNGENVVVFRTFTKIYGLAALPLGYAVVPKPLALALKRRGVGHPRSLDRLAVVAAMASLRDTAFVASARRRVADERARWNVTLDALHLRRTDARANFVFFETGRPYEAFAEGMLARGIRIGRSFPPLHGWARISIGLPEENARAQAALVEVLR